MRFIDFEDERDLRLRQHGRSAQIATAAGRVYAPARVAESPVWRQPSSDENAYRIEEYDQEAGTYVLAGSVQWVNADGAYKGGQRFTLGHWGTYDTDGEKTRPVALGWVTAVKDYRVLRSYATQDEALTLHHALFH